MKPGDLIEWRCPKFGLVWQWRVRSILLGALREESVVEIESVSHRPSANAETMMVPEPLLRGIAVAYSDGGAGGQGSGAAEEITRLRAERDELLEALREIATAQPVDDYVAAGWVSGSPYDRGRRRGYDEQAERARAAIAKAEGEG